MKRFVWVLLLVGAVLASTELASAESLAAESATAPVKIPPKNATSSVQQGQQNATTSAPGKSQSAAAKPAAKGAAQKPPTKPQNVTKATAKVQSKIPAKNVTKEKTKPKTTTPPKKANATTKPAAKPVAKNETKAKPKPKPAKQEKKPVVKKAPAQLKKNETKKPLAVVVAKSELKKIQEEQKKLTVARKQLRTVSAKLSKEQETYKKQKAKLKLEAAKLEAAIKKIETDRKKEGRERKEWRDKLLELKKGSRTKIRQLMAEVKQKAAALVAKRVKLAKAKAKKPSESECNEINGRLIDAEAETMELRQRLRKQRIQSNLKVQAEIERRLDRLQGKLSMLKDDLKSLMKAVAKARGNKAFKLKMKIKKNQRLQKQLRASKRKLERKLHTVDKKIIISLKSRVKSLRFEKRVKTQRRNEIQNILVKLEQRGKTLEKRLDALTTKASSRLPVVRYQRLELEQEAKKVRSHVASLKSALSKLITQRQSVSKKLAKAERQLAEYLARERKWLEKTKCELLQDKLSRALRNALALMRSFDRQCLRAFASKQPATVARAIKLRKDVEVARSKIEQIKVQLKNAKGEERAALLAKVQAAVANVKADKQKLAAAGSTVKVISKKVVAAVTPQEKAVQQKAMVVAEVEYQKWLKAIQAERKNLGHLRAKLKKACAMRLKKEQKELNKKIVALRKQLALAQQKLNELKIAQSARRKMSRISIRAEKLEYRSQMEKESRLNENAEREVGKLRKKVQELELAKLASEKKAKEIQRRIHVRTLRQMNKEQDAALLRTQRLRAKILSLKMEKQRLELTLKESTEALIKREVEQNNREWAKKLTLVKNKYKALRKKIKLLKMDIAVKGKVHEELPKLKKLHQMFSKKLEDARSWAKGHVDTVLKQGTRQHTEAASKVGEAMNKVMILEERLKTLRRDAKSEKLVLKRKIQLAKDQVRNIKAQLKTDTERLERLQKDYEKYQSTAKKHERESLKTEQVLARKRMSEVEKYLKECRTGIRKFKKELDKADKRRDGKNKVLSAWARKKLRLRFYNNALLSMSAKFRELSKRAARLGASFYSRCLTLATADSKQCKKVENEINEVDRKLAGLKRQINDREKEVEQLLQAKQLMPQ